MPPKCERQQPTIKVKLHLPATNWRSHYDRSFEEKHPTEWQTWAQTMLVLLRTFTNGNLRLMLGYWLDALNPLPPDIRLALIQGVAQGYGLDIKTVDDAPDTIEVNLVQRYPPLADPQVKKSGLVVPKKGASDLIIPGNPRYKA